MPSEDVSGTLMNIASGEESPLGNLLKSGDVDKAATMAYAVLSMVDTSEGKMDSDQKKSVSLLKCVRLTVSKIVFPHKTHLIDCTRNFFASLKALESRGFALLWY